MVPIQRFLSPPVATWCLVARASLGVALGGIGACVQAAPAGDEAGAAKEIYGWVERVVVVDAGLSFKAKLDTGAANSSLDARDIQRFRRHGKSFVRFTVASRDSAEVATLERPLARVVRIKEHEGEYQRRPVVTLRICLGELSREVEVNLTDRSAFLYPLLLGRSALEGAAIVDPELTFSRQPDCGERDTAE